MVIHQKEYHFQKKRNNNVLFLQSHTKILIGTMLSLQMNVQYGKIYKQQKDGLTQNWDWILMLPINTVQK